MNILLLCEWESSGDGLQIRKTVQDILEQEGHHVRTVLLNSKELKPCRACFGCWLKTPGQCLISDDGANNIAFQQMNADAVMFISKITYGGFSADIKVYLERSIQNIMPFFVNYQGELHHPMRYKRFPIWIVIGYGHVSDGEKSTFTRLADRNALNMRPDRRLAVTVGDNEELVKKAGNILKILEVGE